MIAVKLRTCLLSLSGGLYRAFKEITTSLIYEQHSDNGDGSTNSLLGKSW